VVEDEEEHDDLHDDQHEHDDEEEQITASTVLAQPSVMSTEAPAFVPRGKKPVEEQKVP